ncbi:hypothetical protein [Phormidesmis priestleyi]|nr:hypothetical protein [Phormidesmis priestleyi]
MTYRALSLDAEPQKPLQDLSEICDRSIALEEFALGFGQRIL